MRRGSAIRLRRNLSVSGDRLGWDDFSTGVRPHRGMTVVSPVKGAQSVHDGFTSFTRLLGMRVAIRVGLMVCSIRQKMGRKT